VCSFITHFSFGSTSFGYIPSMVGGWNCFLNAMNFISYWQFSFISLKNIYDWYMFYWSCRFRRFFRIYSSFVNAFRLKSGTTDNLRVEVLFLDEAVSLILVPLKEPLNLEMVNMLVLVLEKDLF
jgi:hypothetical protein